MPQFLRFISVRGIPVLFLASLIIVLYTTRSSFNSNDYTSFNHLENPSLIDVLNENFVISQASISKCWKFLSCKTDKEWHRYEVPLNLHSKWLFYNYYLSFQYKFANDEKHLIEDIVVTTSNKKPSEGDWFTSSSSSWFGSGIHVWHKIATDKENSPVVRDIDILFGGSELTDCRTNWHFQKQPLPFSSSIPIHLSLLKIKPSELETIKSKALQTDYLKTHGIALTSKNNYKILQITDLHFGEDSGVCFENNCKSDFKTIKFVETLLKNENPDLVVITGDLIDILRVKNFKSAVLKALAPILKLQIPFIFTFGESDYQKFNYNTKPAFFKFIRSLENCLNTEDEESMTLHGLSNYSLKVFHVEDVNMDVNQLNMNSPDALVSVLDSEDRKIDSSQINYLYRINREMEKESSNVFKLLFFHYPLPNFRPIGKFKLIGGYNEKHALDTATNIKFQDDMINCGYQVVSVGHEHENDACLLSNEINDKKDDTKSRQIWLCYGSVTGDSGQTRIDPNYDRKGRMFEVKFKEQELLSWKIRESDSKGFEYQYIHKFN